MPKNATKLSRKAKQNKAKRKQQKLNKNEEEIVSNISCKSISVSEEIEKCNLIRKIFEEFKWKNLSVKIVYHNDKDLGLLTKIKVNTSYLLSKNIIVFTLDNKSSIISQISADAYTNSFRIGGIKNWKDKKLLEKFITSEIKTKRKGIESENTVFLSLTEVLPEEFTLRFNKDLDALSIDFWAQYLDTETGLLFQVKSSNRYILRSIEKFECKKTRSELESNRFWSLLQNDNKLHHLIVEDDNIYILDENFSKHSFAKYIPHLLNKFTTKKIA